MKSIYLDVLASSSLFYGIEKNEINAMLNCLDARMNTYKKGELIYALDDPVSDLGIVLSGSVFLSKLDYKGNAILLDKVLVGDLFAESTTCLGTKKIDADVTAAERSEILFLNVGRIIKTCSSACVFHQRMIRNLLLGIAEKNQQLSRKVEHISKRTTREKLLSYLNSYRSPEIGEWFSIPLNRQQLADYLCVDRSAMSWELCRMRDEGMLEFQKNRFRFLFSPSYDKMEV